MEDAASHVGDMAGGLIDSVSELRSLASRARAKAESEAEGDREELGSLLAMLEFQTARLSVDLARAADGRPPLEITLR